MPDVRFIDYSAVSGSFLSRATVLRADAINRRAAALLVSRRQMSVKLKAYVQIRDRPQDHTGGSAHCKDEATKPTPRPIDTILNTDERSWFLEECASRSPRTRMPP